MGEGSIPKADPNHITGEQMGKTPLAVFTASVHFLSVDNGGRRTPANQGYQPLLHFFDDDAYYGLVFSYFMDRSGKELRKGEPIPKDTVAEFRLYHEDAWRQLRDRIKLGATFELSEGPHVVAHATIESVGNL
jgi:hypothetical protein